MKRRAFMKTSAMGAFFVSTSGIYMSCKNRNSESGQIDCFQPNQEIPVIAEVDVFIAGGTSAAVAAALSIVNQGGSVFLATDHPYLGEDIVGSFNYWNVGIPQSELAHRLFKSKDPQNPIFYKRVLDEALLDHHIDFLYSSFVTDILTDENNAVAGVVISNRSGQQVIKARAVIDATQYATVARLINIPFSGFKAGDQEFTYRVVGNEKKSCLAHEEREANFALTGEPVPVLEYKITVPLKEDSYGEFQKVEQSIRDQVWAPNQMDSADNLIFVPPNPIISKQQSEAKSLDEIDPESLRPRDVDCLFILSGYADVPRNLVRELLKPCNIMSVAERTGLVALNFCRQADQSPLTQSPHNNSTVSGGIKNSFDFIRPSYVQGDVESIEKPLPVFGEYDVVVVGGGTAGAPAGIGAAQQGVSTLVIEYLHGLGGMGTMGLIGSYYHGYREGFTHVMDKAVQVFGGVDHPRYIDRLHTWNKDWKMEYYRSELRRAGADIWFGTIVIGALVHENSLEGVVIATPFGKGVVLAKKIIDSTGSADVAIAAGAEYRHTDKDCLAVQGAGLPPVYKDQSYTNTDWTFINDTDIFDVWRAFVAGKTKYDDANHYDIGKIPQTRERRRIIGDFEISVLDMYNNRTYPDTVSIHKSSFDTHGFTMDPYFNLKPPRDASMDEIAYVPLRSLLPKGLENILVTGLGASADRDAMPVIRMQPCLQNQGYTVGQIAALAVKDEVSFRAVNLKEIQERMVELGSLPASVLTDVDNYPPTELQVGNAIKSVANELDSLETLLWDTGNGLKLLKEAYGNTSDKDAELIYAHVLATYGIADGWDILAEKVSAVQVWDEGWRYRGMGQFGACMSSLDSMLIALGKTRKKDVLPVLFEKAALLKPEHAFSHFRAISLALENFTDKNAASTLYNLLQLDGVQDHAMISIEKAKALADSDWTNTDVRNNSLREIVLARSLFRTGDKEGLGEKILNEYARDLRGHYARHAIDVLGH